MAGASQRPLITNSLGLLRCSETVNHVSGLSCKGSVRPVTGLPGLYGCDTRFILPIGVQAQGAYSVSTTLSTTDVPGDGL